MAGRGPWVMVSPDGVRYYIRDIDAANELADYNSDMKMTRPNLLAYLGANEHSLKWRFRPRAAQPWWAALGRTRLRRAGTQMVPPDGEDHRFLSDPVPDLRITQVHPCQKQTLWDSGFRIWSEVQTVT